MTEIPYQQRVLLDDPRGYFNIPFGVGKTYRVWNGSEGFVKTRGYGLTTYVEWEDGREGSVPIASLVPLP